MKASMKTTLLGIGLAVTVIPVAGMFAFIKLNEFYGTFVIKLLYFKLYCSQIALQI